MLHLKLHLRFHFRKHEKLEKKCEQKDAFDTFEVAVYGSLYTSFISYVAQNKQNWHFKQALGSIGNVRMRIRERERVGLAESVIYCFSGAIFFSSCIQGRLGINKIWLISGYVLYE